MAENGPVGQDLSAMKDDVSRLRRDIGELLAHIFEQGRGRSAAMREQAVARGKRARSAAERQVRERPLFALAVVFLFGLLVGRVTEPRRG